MQPRPKAATPSRKSTDRPHPSSQTTQRAGSELSATGSVRGRRDQRRLGQEQLPVDPRGPTGPGIGYEHPRLTVGDFTRLPLYCRATLTGCTPYVGMSVVSTSWMPRACPAPSLPPASAVPGTVGRTRWCRLKVPRAAPPGSCHRPVGAGPCA